MISITKISEIRQATKLFFRFNKYVLRYWTFELIILLIGIFSIILSLVTPYIGKYVLDKGILARDIRIFIIYTILGIAIYLINLIIGNVHRYLKNYCIRKVRIDLTKDVFKKIKSYSLRVFQSRSSGSHIFRVSNDIISAANVINDTLPNIILTVFKLLAITLIIIFINWKILILIMIYQLLVLFQINLFIKKIEQLIRSNLEKSENIFKMLSDFFSHIYIIKACGTMTVEIKKYFHTYIDRMRLEIKDTRLKIASDLLGNLSDKLFFGLIGFYGSILVIRGQMSLGSLGAVMAYISQGTSAYSALLGLGQQIILNRISLERITEICDVEAEIREYENAKTVSLKGKIEFQNVSFGYKQGQIVLENINFCILPGAHIALVGHSGSGKTTILNLILRLYDVNKGTIFLDAHDLRELKFKSIYSQISIAPQEPFLWDCSIKDNIRYGKEDASVEDIRRATQITQIDDFIECLPNGFDMPIGEDACWISQGQKQRIAIARAVIKKPRILILDEAMSSLDSEIEDKIVTNIRKEFKNSTVIIVSHRLSTVKKMDLVYFLEGPSKIDIGTHEELILSNPKYVDLFASQIESAVFNEGKTY